MFQSLLQPNQKAIFLHTSHDKRSVNIFDIILERISRKNIISEVSFYGDKNNI